MRNIILVLAFVIAVIILSGLMGFILWPLAICGFLYMKTQDTLKVYVASFGLGTVQDLVTGFPLGFSSLILLGFSLALFSLGLRFRADLKVTIILTLVFELIYALCFNFISF